MDETDTVSSITMLALKAPLVLVLDPQTQYFYLCPSPASNMTVDDLTSFLTDITLDKIPASISTTVIIFNKSISFHIFYLFVILNKSINFFTFFVYL